MFSIFNINKFVQDCGGVEEAGEALDYFRESTAKAGFPGLHLQVIGFGGNEWVEGGYLLPDMKSDFAYLKAVKQVVENP